MREELETRLKAFWANHTPGKWGIETERLGSSSVKATITLGKKTVMSAYAEGGSGVNHLEEEAIIKAIDRLLISEGLNNNHWSATA